MLTSLARSGGHACLIVTHDARLVEFADRTERIEDGRLVGAAPATRGRFVWSRPDA